MYKLEGNEFRLTPFRARRAGACKIMNSEKSYFTQQLMASTDIKEECPILKGNYSMNWCPDLSVVPPNFNGKFKLIVNLYRNNDSSPVHIYTIIARLDRIMMA